MAKKIIVLFLFLASLGKAQCPQVFNYLGVPSSNPYWISCTGGSYTLNFSAPTSWGTYTINWGDGTANFNAASYTASTTIVHTYTATIDTFPLTLIIPSLSCTLTGVVVMELPVVAGNQIAFGGTNTACAPAILNFNNNSTNVSKTTTFTWNFGDGSPPAIFSYTNNGTNIAHTYTPGAVNCQTMVTMTAQNYCSLGVPTKDSIPIQIFDKDVANFSPAQFVKCWPDNVFNYTNTSSQTCAGQGNTFQRQEMWDFGNYWGKGVDSLTAWSPWPPATPVSVSYTAVGTYTTMLKDSSFCGVVTKVLTVAIINAPVAGLGIPAAPLCQNSPITFTNNCTPGFFYQWNFGDGGGYIAAPFGPMVHTYTSTGTYSVELIVAIPGGGNSCKDTIKSVINILVSPVANYAFTGGSGCGSLAGVTFTDSSIGATGWSWNFGNGNTSTLSIPPAQNYTTAGTYTVSLTAIAANGCVNTKSATINVFQKPGAAFTPTFICANTITSFTDLSTFSPLDPIISWDWNFGDGAPNSSLQNPAHTYTAVATYTVKLIVKTANCIDSVIVVIPANTNSGFTFTMTPASGCTPLAVNFTSPPGVITANWNFGDGNTSALINPANTYTNGTLVNQSFTVTLIATNAAGCVDTARQIATVFPKPIANFTLNPSIGCSPLISSFTNLSVLNATSNWDFGDGTLATLPNPIHTFTTNASFTNTTYSVSLVIFSIDGCRDTASTFVTLLPHPKSIFGVDTPACSPKILTFTNSAVGAITYNWDFGNGNTSSSASPTLTQQYINVSGVNQTYLVSLLTTNASGCSDVKSVSVVIHSQLNLNLTANKDSGCTALKVTFPGFATVNNYAWTFGDGGISSFGNVSHTFTNSTTSTIIYTVQLIASDIYGCADTASKIIKVFPKPIAFFTAGPPTVEVLNQSITCVNTSTLNNTNAWTFGDGGTSSAANPVYTYTSVGLYQVTLIITSTKGCKDTFALGNKINAIEIGSLQIPNAFTPNLNGSGGGVFNPSDLSNDIFHPVIKGGVDTYQFTIYSRWGEILFDTKDATIGWDGYYQGKLCTQDIYVWKINLTTLDGAKFDKTGDVLLLK